jgi:hypothetical protein
MEAFMETTKQTGHAQELKRLADNYEVFKDAMGGPLWAPADLSKSGLRILDSVTPDGMYHFFLVSYFLFCLYASPPRHERGPQKSLSSGLSPE